jgi:antitoxin VapB
MLGEFRSMTAPQTEDIAMAIAKLFKIGRDQAVRLPKGYRFEGEEVYIKRVGAAVVLLPRTQETWDDVLRALEMFEPGFRLEREQPKERQKRPLLKKLLDKK